MDYVIWNEAYDAKAAQLSGPLGVNMSHEIDEGLSRADGFPPEANFEVLRVHKTAVRLRDNHYKSGRAVISARAKDLLEAEKLRNVEYLPVHIIDAKRKVVPNYFMVNPINPVDCLNVQKSGPTYNSLDNSIAWVERLVIETERIPQDTRLLRVKELTRTILIDRKLSELLLDPSLKGFGFLELSEYES